MVLWLRFFLVLLFAGGVGVSAEHIVTEMAAVDPFAAEKQKCQQWAKAADVDVTSEEVVEIWAFVNNLGATKDAKGTNHKFPLTKYIQPGDCSHCCSRADIRDSALLTGNGIAVASQERGSRSSDVCAGATTCLEYVALVSVIYL